MESPLPSRRRSRAPRSQLEAGFHSSADAWEFVHVAVDDASRLAYVEVLANELATTTAGFLTIKGSVWTEVIVVAKPPCESGDTTLWMETLSPLPA